MAVTYRTCPKCGHEAGAGGAESCARCGLIYAKYFSARVASAMPARAAAEAPSSAPDESLLARAKALLFHVPEEVASGAVCLRAAFLAALVVYGIRLAAMDIPEWEMAGSLMHPPMVPIHEFGHLLFRPFGEFMTLLGGSLFQAGLPLVFGAIFVVKNRDPYAAAVMLWWSAVAVMDVAPYVYDAQHPQHVLLTGRTGDTGAHDFIDVLGALGLLMKAQAVGIAVHRFGVLMLLASFAWAAWLVWAQFGRRRRQ